MILNSKQLEELENIHDAVTDFEEEASTEEAGFDEGAESALAWRRGMIEKAASQVKKTWQRPFDPHSTYNLGALVFDAQTKQFGRVVAASAGQTQIHYLSQANGGSAGPSAKHSAASFSKAAKERSSKRAVAPVKKAAGSSSAAKTTAEKKAKQQPADVEELSSVNSLMANEKASRARPPEKSLPKPKVLKKMPTKKTTTLKKKVKPLPAKPSHSKGSLVAKSTASSKNSTARAHISLKFVTDPVADPNGYIKQNFKLMSNQELAVATGLSEHTIRRKLGEWKLKRPTKNK